MTTSLSAIGIHPGRAYVTARNATLRLVRRFTLAGDDVSCPLCATRAARFVTPNTHDRLCYRCGSRGRQRFLWSYLGPRIRRGDAVLHVAPEPCLTRALKRAGGWVRSIDLDSPLADLRVDLTDTEGVARAVGLGWWKWVVCSHVLEHIHDDRAAMRTLKELLAPSGTLIVQVPMSGTDRTYEDASITTPEARERAFGQHDHVRIYGTDVVTRLRGSGLAVTSVLPSAHEARVMELDPKDALYIARHHEAAT